jgi:hypothetical protein
VTNESNGGLTLKSPEIIAEKHKWAAQIQYFNRIMQERDAIVRLIGDSLSKTMMCQILCLEEFTEQKEKIPFFRPNISNPYLGRLHSNYTMIMPAGSAHPLLDPSSIEWYHDIIKSKSTKKYIVLNTGAWFGQVRRVVDGGFLPGKGEMNQKKISRHYKKKKVDYVENYRVHFAEDSSLMQLVRSLVLDNITVIWRDTSPADVCGKHRQREDHALFPEYNTIARKAMGNAGALMLDDIWNATLPYWDQHWDEDKDQLHYCLYQFNSAQNIWIEQLMDLILNN